MTSDFDLQHWVENMQILSWCGCAIQGHSEHVNGKECFSAYYNIDEKWTL